MNSPYYERRRKEDEDREEHLFVEDDILNSPENIKKQLEEKENNT